MQTLWFNCRVLAKSYSVIPICCYHFQFNAISDLTSLLTLNPSSFMLKCFKTNPAAWVASPQIFWEPLTLAPSPAVALAHQGSAKKGCSLAQCLLSPRQAPREATVLLHTCLLTSPCFPSSSHPAKVGSLRREGERGKVCVNPLPSLPDYPTMLGKSIGRAYERA